MKKLFLIVLATALSAPLFAQRESASSIYSTENGAFSVSVINHIGWGYSFVKSDDFTPRGSGEVFLNVLKFKLYPAEAFGLEAGLDCKESYIGSKESLFYQTDDHLARATEFSLPGVSVEKARSEISVFSLSVPVVAKIVMGKFFIGGGAEANFNLVGDTSYRYDVKDKTTRVQERKLKLNTFSYNFVGTVGLDKLSVFAKFYPKNSPMLTEGGVSYNYWTLGVALCL